MADKKDLRGRPTKSHIRDNLIELVFVLKQGYGYELYKKYVDAMYHTVFRMVNDQTEAQDIVQECFIKVFQKIGSYRGDATLGAWIKRIAINSAINALRNKKRLLEFPSDTIQDQPEEISEAEYTRWAPATIHTAIGELPFGCRSVLNMYAFEGFSHKEISEILGISESTSKTQYKRAKSLLRDVIADKYAINEF